MRATIPFFVLLAAMAGPFAAGAPGPVAREEAESILTAARQSSQRPGSYRTEIKTTWKNGECTVLILTKVATGAPALTRTEKTFRNGNETRNELTIRNAEGDWRIIGHQAVLFPAPKNVNEADAAMKEAFPGGSGDWLTKLRERTSERAKALADHVKTEGERYNDGGRELVRITQTYDEEARRIIIAIFDDAIDGAKNQMSLPKRILAAPVLKMMRPMIEKLVPSRDTYVIDPLTSEIVSHESFDAKGQARTQDGTVTAGKVADLDDSIFTLPAGVELHRPKTPMQHFRLVRKLEADQKKAK